MPLLLIIDGDCESRELLERRLALEGFQTVGASSAREALTQWDVAHPDLVLADLDTTESPGADIVDQLRRHPAMAATPVIGITMANAPLRPGPSGADAIATKPLQVDRLLASIRSLLGPRARPPQVIEARRPGASPSLQPRAMPARILVVDDQEDNLDLLTRRLALAGYTPLGASSGEEALALVDRSPPDCLLLDVNMPGLSGFEVLAAVRRTHAGVDLPIVMVTARGDSSDVVKALSEGANDYVTKPIDMPVLLARLALQVEALELRRQLRREKELRDGLIDSAREMILCVDSTGMVSEFNRHAEATLGWGRREALGRPASTFFDNEAKLGELLRAAGDGAQFEGEALWRARHGRAVPVRYSCAPLCTASGRHDGVVILAMDITRERNLEKERQRLERLRDDFMAVATHDMKGPLSSIMGFSTLLQTTFKPGDVLTEEGADFIQRIGRTSRMLKALVEDFLDFRALQSNQLTLQSNLVDMGQLVHDCVDLVLPVASDRGLRLQCQAPTGRTLAMGDARRLRQVAMNFLDNALKFTPRGGTIIARAEVRGDDAVVEVEDTGPGVPADDLQRVFQPWVVSSTRATTGEKSTGLGLSICAEFVRLHGGRHGVRNKPEGGAVFHFSLPLVGAPPGRTWLRELTPLPPMPARATRPGALVLVVEDEPSSALLVKVLLERAGYRSITAANVAEACAMALKNVPDALLLDSRLGQEDGMDVPVRLAADPTTAHIPIALVSGEAPERLGPRAAAQGISRIVEKPIDPAHLLRVVEELLALPGETSKPPGARAGTTERVGDGRSVG